MDLNIGPKSFEFIQFWALNQHIKQFYLSIFKMIVDSLIFKSLGSFLANFFEKPFAKSKYLTRTVIFLISNKVIKTF